MARQEKVLPREPQRPDGDLVRGAEILVLSTHMPEVIRKWCSRAIWLDQGRVRADGTPDAVLAAYLTPPTG